MPVQYATPEPFEVSLNGYLRDLLQIPVFPLRVPQKVDSQVVRVVYSPISGGFDQNLSGASGIATQTIQLDVYSPSPEDVLVVEQQIRFALQDFAGMMGATRVLNAIPVGKPSGFTPNDDKSDKGTYRRTCEYRFTYVTDIPLRDLPPGE